MIRMLLAALVLVASGAELGEARGTHRRHEIDVMSQNQYLGADLGPVIAAKNFAEFNAALVAALEQIAANKFPERARRLASLIAHRGADLVGLQEVFRFECFNIPVPGPDCDDPSVAGAFNDHLQETLVNLSARRRPRTVAGVVVTSISRAYRSI